MSRVALFCIKVLVLPFLIIFVVGGNIIGRRGAVGEVEIDYSRLQPLAKFAAKGHMV